MTEENDRNDEPEATEGDEPEAEEPVSEEVQPPDEPAAEPTADEQAPVDEAPAEEPAAEEAPADEAAPEPAEAPQKSAEPEAAERLKAKDQAPGADLEPIALEPERELSAEEKARAEAEAEERARLEAEQEAGDEPVARRGPQVELAADATIQATGKRKSAIARVVVRRGEGAFQVNNHPLDEYFPRQYLQTLARSPLVTTGYESSIDVAVRVHGGGIAGQAAAVRQGVAKALTEIDSELRPELKRRGLLTRDARKKERRKAGLKKARKRPQFSKR
jgi:small subunit ribosomal protein S9